MPACVTNDAFGHVVVNVTAMGDGISNVTLVTAVHNRNAVDSRGYLSTVVPVAPSTWYAIKVQGFSTAGPRVVTNVTTVVVCSPAIDPATLLPHVTNLAVRKSLVIVINFVAR